MISKLEILDQSCFAQCFSLKEKVIFSHHLNPIYLAKEEIYSKPGDTSDGCVLLAEGALELKIQNKLRVMRSGEAFGFLGVLAPAKRSLLITALEKSILLSFSYTQFKSLESVAPKLAQKLKSEIWVQSLPTLMSMQANLENMFNAS